MSVSCDIQVSVVLLSSEILICHRLILKFNLSALDAKMELNMITKKR